MPRIDTGTKKQNAHGGRPSFKSFIDRRRQQVHALGDGDKVSVAEAAALAHDLTKHAWTDQPQTEEDIQACQLLAARIENV